MEKVEQNKLIDTLKKLIRGDEALVRQMKRTIAVVDENLHHPKPPEPGQASESDRDKR
jgi:hypothetical protein